MSSGAPLRRLISLGAMLHSPLCDRLGIRYPLVQGAIGGITTAELAVAVSEAGGLGTIAMAGRGVDGTRRAVERFQTASNAPFAANFILEFAVADELAVCLELGVPMISLFWGDPTPHIGRIHDSGALVLMSVGSVAEAGLAAEAGVDVIVAQGWEAGGHVRGNTSTLALIPRVVDEVSPVPVIAAGGIADGRGLAAVLALGAQAAWIGTRFVMADEANAHPIYQRRLIEAEADDTLHSSLFDVGWEGAPGRVIRNSTVAMWEESGRPEREDRPGRDEEIVRAGDDIVRRYEAVTAKRQYEGDVEAMPLWAGQGVGLIRRTQPAAAMVTEIIDEAEDALRQLR